MWRDFIAMFGTLLRHDSKTVADFDPLDGIDPHHGSCDFRIQLFYCFRTVVCIYNFISFRFQVNA